jgi:hypothetical protein
VVAVDKVMRSLAAVRPIFHSEADFQFAFAQVLSRLATSVRCRLEVPRAREGRRNEYLDLLCMGDETSTAIEFKYFTRPWVGEADGEAYSLRAHAATDLARLYFVHDIVRLERTPLGRESNGLAIMLTNEPRLWTAPTKRRRPTNDLAFRIHEGARLSGTLDWGNGYAANQRELSGSYEARWQDFSNLDERPGGRFRWLVMPVERSAQVLP